MTRQCMRLLSLPQSPRDSPAKWHEVRIVLENRLVNDVSTPHRADSSCLPKVPDFRPKIARANVLISAPLAAPVMQQIYGTKKLTLINAPPVFHVKVAIPTFER